LTLLLVACGAGDEGETETPEIAEGLPTAALEETEQPPATVEPATPERANTPEPAGGPVELTVMTHDSFNASEEVLRQFEEEHNVSLVLLPAGDTGTALNQAILAREDPLADLFYGVDNTFLSRALDADIFEPYTSPLLDRVPDRYELDESQRLLPVDYSDVCLNYDKAWFEENELDPPQDLASLADDAYTSLLVVENPATSSPGLAFMLATIGAFGTEGDYTWLDYWADLRENDVLVTNDWNDAYYGNFTVASDGNRPIVVSYASSPPAEVIFADPPLEEAPSASITASNTCFRQVEFVGILRGTEHRQLAEAFVDFMLGETFQEDIPLNMFVFPVNENAELPQEFVRYATLSEEPATVAPATIDENREQWIEAWTDTVLR
jgi:thiamine transport system substrate-binding protein